MTTLVRLCIKDTFKLNCTDVQANTNISCLQILLGSLSQQDTIHIKKQSLFRLLWCYQFAAHTKGNVLMRMHGCAD